MMKRPFSSAAVFIEQKCSHHIKYVSTYIEATQCYAGLDQSNPLEFCDRDSYLEIIRVDDLVGIEDGDKLSICAQQNLFRRMQITLSNRYSINTRSQINQITSEAGKIILAQNCVLKVFITRSGIVQCT